MAQAPLLKAHAAQDPATGRWLLMMLAHHLVIDHTTDGCAIATALRHQGYTFIDMGLLESARLAYEKSLEVDPTSQLAAHELKVIAQNLAKRQGNPKAAGDYVPPPLNSVTISKCNRSGQ